MRVLHASHDPEPEDSPRRLFSDVTFCRVCCRLVAGRHGVSRGGEEPCRGKQEITLRDLYRTPSREAR